MEGRQRIASGVFPRGWPDEPAELRAECLIEGADPHVEVRVTFLQTAMRQVHDSTGLPVESLVVAGERYAAREEVIEHEVSLTNLPNRAAVIETAGSRSAELVEAGALAGRLSWNWEPLHATVEAWVEGYTPGLWHVCVNIANRLEWDGRARERARLQALFSPQMVLRSPDGAFPSVADPPAHLREELMACRNEGLWPVTVGEAAEHHTVLASTVPLAS